MAAAGFSALAAAVALSACTSVVADQRSFEGTRWAVTAINGRAVPASTQLHLRFERGTLGGNLGCNSFSGGYRVTGQQLVTTTPIAMTRMACDFAGDEPGPRPMDLERAGTAVLSRPMQMRWESGARLTLSNQAGSISLERSDQAGVAR